METATIASRTPLRASRCHTDLPHQRTHTREHLSTPEKLRTSQTIQNRLASYMDVRNGVVWRICLLPKRRKLENSWSSMLSASGTATARIPQLPPCGAAVLQPSPSAPSSAPPALLALPPSPLRAPWLPKPTLQLLILSLFGWSSTAPSCSMTRVRAPFPMTSRMSP